MSMFADQVKIFIKSGKGGDGHVSFRRELFVPDGGPDGGDGGRGGDIIFEVDKGLNTLFDFRHVRKYVAKPGEEGGKRRCHGKDAEDLVIRVPEGTVIREAETGLVVADMSGEENQRKIILKGGKGGTGNMHYATSTMQAPKYAKPGQPGKELWVILELKTIADVGLVGYPNAGKSTLISRVTNARPKIANYPFTTMDPHLGVVDMEGAGFVIADIPGLIEGASEGIGLGHDFLKHIERTRVLIHVVDAAGTEGRDPVEDVRVINAELEAYNPELLTRPMVIAANKIDAIYDEEDDVLTRLKETFEPEGIKVFPISGVSGEGIKELIFYVAGLLKQIDKKPLVFEPEYDVDAIRLDEDLPFTVEINDNGEFVVEGPLIDKMLGYTNLDSEKGFQFFQKFLKERGILKELEAKGIEEGDTVRMYGFAFDYYK